MDQGLHLAPVPVLCTAAVTPCFSCPSGEWPHRHRKTTTKRRLSCSDSTALVFVSIPTSISLIFSSRYPVDRFHFFSTQVDLSRPFPSAAAADDCDDDFCWNGNMRMHFVATGLSFLCPPLLCGCVFSHIPDTPPPSSSPPPQPRLALAVIMRKCSTHPGTRFEARGVDSQGNAGTYLCLLQR